MAIHLDRERDGGGLAVTRVFLRISEWDLGFAQMAGDKALKQHRGPPQ